MAVEKIPVIPSFIENTTTVAGYVNGVLRSYEITPLDNYVLHDKDLDMIREDDFGNQYVELWFTPSTAICLPNYDFVANPREFYTVPRDSIPENQILGGGDNNDHEIA